MKRVSPALVVALAAFFVAAAGTGYAALKLPANSVTTKQVKDHSLMGRDFKRGQVPPGPQGAVGPAGSTGSAGNAGPQGPPGPGTSYARVALPMQTINGSTDAQVWTCPGGGVAINGGAEGSGVTITASGPTNALDPAGADQTPGEWYVAVSHSNTLWQYHPWVVCAH